MPIVRQVEVTCDIRQETDAAYLIYDGKVEVWIPKSQVSDYTKEGGKISTIFVPQWLAEEKGLV